MPADYVPSPELTVRAHQDNFRLTKHPRHDDFMVWEGGRIVAQGGRILMERIFKERTE